MLLSLPLIQQAQLTGGESCKFDTLLMNNFPGNPNQLQPGSGTSSPATVPPVDPLMGVPPPRQTHKRASDDLSLDGFFPQGGAIERPAKRLFTGTPTPNPHQGPHEKLGSPQGFPLRNNLMAGATFLSHQNQDAQRHLAASQMDFHQNRQSLLASSLANRHAELAQRQLFSRYFAPQMRLNGLATSLSAPPSLGLGSRTGGQPFPMTSTSSGPALTPGAAGSSLAARLSRPNHQDPLQSMAARFQQPPQQPQSELQCFPAATPVGSTRIKSERLPEQQGLVMPWQAEEAADGDSSFSPIPLAMEEDPNWLSDFHIFVRNNLVELCWASSEDVALRNANSRVSGHQVGIRCRCCAHLNPTARAQRSSAFPSSVGQIYQSFTMMLRAHFSSCSEIPPALKEKFLALKSKTTQGATDSKQYWIYSARKIGMVDSEDGIVMTKATIQAARAIPPFGTDPATGRGGEPSSAIGLVAPTDRTKASGFLYTLLCQTSRVRLQPNEQKGNKKSLQLGLPGFACRHCCQLGRMGQSRIFPARRRTLSTKIYDLYEHMKRCTACPQETKDLLRAFHDRENYNPKSPGHKDFLDVVWSRLVEGQLRG